jgi:DNA repair exonuclease SbcCD ATPase subunit
MAKESDMMITCRQCGKEFLFAESEQAFYKEKGFVLPLHCKECRTSRKNAGSVTCSGCQTEISRGSPLFCNACQATVQLEVELEARRLQSTIEESKARLEVLEAEKARLSEEANSRIRELQLDKDRMIRGIEAKLTSVDSDNSRLRELLLQQQQAAADLKKRLSDSEGDLEKSRRYQVRLEWLEPSFARLEQRLDAFESNQRNLAQSVGELILRSGRSRAESGVLDIAKRIFRPRRSPEPGL